MLMVVVQIEHNWNDIQMHLTEKLLCYVIQAQGIFKRQVEFVVALQHSHAGGIV